MITEIKKKIVSDYKYKTELHAHTLPISPCSEFSPEALARVYEKTGVDSIVLTNHFTPVHLTGKTKEQFVREYIEAFHKFETCAKTCGITAIFGIELRFEENVNDYLIFGIDEDDAYGICNYIPLGLERFCKEFKRNDMLVIQAHPKRDRMTEVDFRLLDGKEAFNMHPGHNSRVATAAREANKEGLIITGGTDFHHPTHEASCLVRTKKRLLNSHDIVAVLKEKEYVLDIGGSIVLP